MVLPTPFSTAAPLVASFTFAELASGTGFIRVYGYDTIDDTTTTLSLGEQVVFSQNQETSMSPNLTGTSGTFAKVADLDFDLSVFNSSRTLRGTAHITLAYAIGGTGGDTESYIIARLQKWDGSTETSIATTQTPTLAFSGSTVTELANMNIIVPETHFAYGETLRLTLEHWGKYTGGATANTGITVAHSPKNADGTTITVANTGTTQLILDAPFKIER